MTELVQGLLGVKEHMQRAGLMVLVSGPALTVGMRIGTRLSELNLFTASGKALFFSLPLPLSFPPAQYAALTQLLAEINARLVFAGFRMQPTGEGAHGVLFCAQVFFDRDGAVCTQIIDRVIALCQETATRYFPVFEQVARGGAVPQPTELPAPPTFGQEPAAAATDPDGQR